MKDLQHEPCSHFGGCPECGRSDGYRNVRRDHWFVCDEHKTKWLVGANLFSCWREESDEIWRENTAKLAEYRKAKPRYFQTTAEEKAKRKEYKAIMRLRESVRVLGVEVAIEQLVSCRHPDSEQAAELIRLMTDEVKPYTQLFDRIPF